MLVVAPVLMVASAVRDGNPGSMSSLERVPPWVFGLMVGLAAWVAASRLRCPEGRARMAGEAGLIVLGATIAAHALMLASSDSIGVSRHPVLGSYPVGNTTLADGVEDAVALKIAWEGDDASASGANERGQEFLADLDGRRAGQRLARLLSVHAANPGPRPELREIVLAPTDDSLIAVKALNWIEGSHVTSTVRSLAIVARSTERAEDTSQYHEYTHRLVIKPSSARVLARALRSEAPPPTDLDSALRDFEHEVEHAMSVRGEPARWIRESTAELLPQWAGRDARLARAGVRVPHAGVRYEGVYGNWTRMLDDLMHTCGYDSRNAHDFAAAAALLRDPERRSSRLLAACLLDVRDYPVEEGVLAELIDTAGESRRAERRLRDIIVEPSKAAGIAQAS